MSETVYQRDEFPSLSGPRPDPPRGWIQWKGTDVCIDIHCGCGSSFHFDGRFMYHVQCSDCGQVYECSGDIRLIPMDFRPDGTILLEDDGPDESD